MGQYAVDKFGTGIYSSGAAGRTKHTLQQCTTDAARTRVTLQQCTTDAARTQQTLAHTSGWVTRAVNSLQQFTTDVGRTQNSLQNCPTASPTAVTTSVGGPSGPTSMNVTSTKPWCTVGSYHAYSWSLTNTVNQGWQWSATVPGYLPATFAGTQLVMQIGDGRGGTCTSPPLVALSVTYSYDTNGGEQTTLSGRDLTSWILTQPHQSLNTFKQTSFAAVVSAISAATGVQIKAPNVVGINLAEEDLKQSNWWDPLARLAEVACCNLIVDRSGHLVFVPVRWTGGACVFKPDSCSQRRDKSRDVTGFLVSKKTSHYTANDNQDRYYTFSSTGYKIQALRTPVIRPTITDVSSLGAVTLVSFWTGNPTDPRSQLIAFYPMGDTSFNLTVPVFSSDPVATYMALNVNMTTQPGLANLPVAVRVKVGGSAPPSISGGNAAQPGVDLSFTQTVGTITGAGAHPGPVRNEPLYPSKAYVQAHSADLLYEANKSGNVVTASGPIDCAVDICMSLTMQLPHAIPPARVESITHSGDMTGFTTRLSGFII